MARIAFLVIVASGLALPMVAVGGKSVLQWMADAKARRLVEQLGPEARTPDSVMIELTRRIHGWYVQNRQIQDPPLLWRLRPYLTHELLPELFRLPEGLIDTLYVEGICDDATRTLIYILDEAGIEGRQLNIVNRFTGAHTVVLARLSDGREVMLDPLYGIVPKLDGKLVSPTEAFKASKKGREVNWYELAPTSNNGFYEKTEHAVFAVQNAGMEIKAPIHLNGATSISLGRPDGDSLDVMRDGMSRNLTSHWTYLGHKFDRGWVRTLTFAQDTHVKIGLVEPVNVGFITTDVQPRIEGKTLIYEIAAGGSLRFIDGRAKRDWIRFKSYQDIDYIVFEARP